MNDYSGENDLILPANPTSIINTSGGQCNSCIISSLHNTAILHVGVKSYPLYLPIALPDIVRNSGVLNDQSGL